jgi:hypothetical protein
VQGLDRQRDPRRERLGLELADRVAHALPGSDEIAGAVGQSARDEHEGGSAEGGRLLDGPAVVVEGGPPRGALRHGEESGTAEARDPQSRVAREGGTRLEAELGNRLAPQPDGRDARADGRRDRLRQRGVLDGCLVERESARR